MGRKGNSDPTLQKKKTVLRLNFSKLRILPNIRIWICDSAYIGWGYSVGPLLQHGVRRCYSRRQVSHILGYFLASLGLP